MEDISCYLRLSDQEERDLRRSCQQTLYPMVRQSTHAEKQHNSITQCQVLRVTKLYAYQLV